MTKARLDGLYPVVLGALVFVLMGSALETVAPVSTVDFRVVYFSAKCLLDHRDPYNSSELDNIYRTEGGESARDSAQIKRSERRYNYLPTAFLITLPFAILPFGPAHIIWLLFTASCVLLASYLIWGYRCLLCTDTPQGGWFASPLPRANYFSFSATLPASRLVYAP